MGYTFQLTLSLTRECFLSAVFSASPVEFLLYNHSSSVHCENPEVVLYRSQCNFMGWKKLRWAAFLSCTSFWQESVNIYNQKCVCIIETSYSE